MSKANAKNNANVSNGLKPDKIIFSAGSLDTLAQLPPDTSQAKSEINFSPSETASKPGTLLKRARAKYMTNAYVSKLSKLGGELSKSYQSSYACASVLEQKDSKLIGKYCNQRWCLVCNRIRTAKLMNGYLPLLAELPNKYFVTLTAPNVPGSKLREEVTRYYKNISLITRYIKEKKKLKFKGLRKFECTYNADKKTFHPHYHMIVDSAAAAELLVSEWLLRFPKAVREAQDIRPANDQACNELFKYFTKIVSKSSSNNEQKQITGIFTSPLNSIFLAVRKTRTFQAMGIKKIKEDIEELQSEEYPELDRSRTSYQFIENDWIDTATGEALTGYVPSEAVKKIVHSIY